MRGTCYELRELGRLIGAYGTEKEAMAAAQKECAVINIGRSQSILASGYTIEKVRV